MAYQALDQSDDIVLLLESDDPAGNKDAVVIAVNGAFRRASGFADEQVIGRRAVDLFPAGTDAETVRNAMNAGTSLRTELTCRRADGGAFVLGFHLMPAPARTPGRRCFAILGRDITAQIEARRMQNSVQRLLAKVFMSVDEAVAIVNASGRIMMTNPGIDQLLGYQPNELVGRLSLDLVAPDARAAVAEAIKRQMEQGIAQPYVAPLLKADGSQIVASVASAVVSNDDLKQFRIVTLRAHAGGPTGSRAESVGRIRLVGLDDVRTAMGDRWRSVATRAMATAEAVIKRRCGDQDSFSRIDDTSFLVCFGTLNERDASFRAAIIGREIRDRLIGQGNDAATAEVRSIAAAIRFPDQGVSPATLQTMMLGELDAQLERFEREARQTLRTALAGASCDVKRITGRGADETLAMQVGLPGVLERALVVALAALPVEETRSFDQDGLLLGLAARHAIEGMTRGEALPILVNVSFDVFATRAASERYFATCQKIDPRVASHLIMLLSALPEGLPKSRQLDCVNRLRPFCRGVGYRVENLANLALLDLSFSGTPIVSLPARPLVEEDPEKLRTLLGSLHARRARVLVREVASERDAAWLRLSGVDMIAMGGADGPDGPAAA